MTVLIVASYPEFLPGSWVGSICWCNTDVKWTWFGLGCSWLGLAGCTALSAHTHSYILPYSWSCVAIELRVHAVITFVSTFTFTMKELKGSESSVTCEFVISTVGYLSQGKITVHLSSSLHIKLVYHGKPYPDFWSLTAHCVLQSARAIASHPILCLSATSKSKC